MEQKATHPLAGKHIVVAGAGIAGLAFIRGLTRFWPQDVERPHITVFDRDPRRLPNERGNYSLGLRSDKSSGGLQALQKLGIIDEIYNARVPGSTEAAWIRDANWNRLMGMVKPPAAPDGLPTSAMRITRNALREVLLQSIPDYVETRWEMTCESAAQLKDGRMEIKLKDGSTEECDLLIVADGASSKIRSHLRPNDGLNYAGVVSVGGNAVFDEDKIPKVLDESFGPVLGGDGHTLIVFPIVRGSYVWFVTRREPEPATPVKGEEALKRKDELADQALREGAVFGEPLRQLVAATDPGSFKIFNAQDKTPVSHDHIKEQPVCYIGDSGHAMSPFAGNGANMAICDGLVLGENLAKSISVATAAATFDKDSIPRSKASIRRSHIVISMMHATGFKLWFALLFLKIVIFFSRR